MTLKVGKAIRGTGLAGAMAKARKAAYPNSYFPEKDKLVELEAKAILGYLMENMEVEVDTGTGKGVILDGTVEMNVKNKEGELVNLDVEVDTGTGKGKIK